MAYGKSLELAKIGPTPPKTGCVKKGCRLAWEDHLTKTGRVQKKFKDAGHATGGPSGLGS